MAKESKARKLLSNLKDVRISTYYKGVDKGITIHFSDNSFLDIIVSPVNDNRIFSDVAFKTGTFDESAVTVEDPMAVTYDEDTTDGGETKGQTK